MSWYTGKHMWRWGFYGIAAFAGLLLVGHALRLYLHDLADRSLPRPPADIVPARSIQRARDMSVPRRPIERSDRAGLAPAGSAVEASVHLPALLNAGTADAIDGEYVLWAEDRATRAALLSQARAHGVQIVDQYGDMIRVRVADQERLAALLARISGNVELESNIRMRVPLRDDPGESLPAPSTPYRGFGDQALAWLGISDPDPGWGQGIRVAVLDTGVQGVPVGARLDLVGQGEFGDHGALVASILQQALPGGDIMDVQVMSADGTGDSYTVAKGIREAVDGGANLINMSIGTRGNSRALEEAVQHALDHNVLIVASSGNEGVERILYPAAYEGVLSVAAIDAEERHLHFSNRGEGVDLAAPGVGVSIDLDTEAEPVSFSGTSAAAPFVTASAGIALSSDGSLDVAGLRAILEDTANDTGEPGRNTLTGKGVVSPQRIQEREESGIVDMAVLRPYFHVDDEDRAHSVSVAAQNRGTVVLPDVTMIVNINGREYQLEFVDVGPGHTVAHTFPLPEDMISEGAVDVQLQAIVPNDIRPGNNQIRKVWLPGNS